MTLEHLKFDHPQHTLLGVPISLLDMGQTLDVFNQILSEAEGTHLVVTADATALVIAHDNPEFRTLLDEATLITPDGAGIIWALKRQGVSNPQKVSGVDLVQRLVEMSASTGTRLYFLGAAPGVAELAAEKFRLKFPGCNIVGTQHGYFPAESDAVIAEQIAQTKPDVLLVAMGMPRQEKFIITTRHIIQAKLAMGVGGSFDVFSGKTKRAPVIFQKMHLEWLWRLMMDPSKISKVKVLPRFVAMVRRNKP